VNITASPDGRDLQIDVSGFEPADSGVSVKNPSRRPFGLNRVEVTVEMRDTGNHDPDIGWVSAAAATIAGGRPGAQPFQHLWSGKITLPEATGSGKYRIVVQEFESYYDDDIQAVDPTKGVAARLVYADTIDL
jgi:hypothetical protein